MDWCVCNVCTDGVTFYYVLLYRLESSWGRLKDYTDRREDVAEMVSSLVFWIRCIFVYLRCVLLKFDMSTTSCLLTSFCRRYKQTAYVTQISQNGTTLYDGEDVSLRALAGRISPYAMDLLRDQVRLFDFVLFVSVVFFTVVRWSRSFRLHCFRIVCVCH